MVWRRQALGLSQESRAVRVAWAGQPPRAPSPPEAGRLCLFLLAGLSLSGRIFFSGVVLGRERGGSAGRLSGGPTLTPLWND